MNHSKFSRLLAAVTSLTVLGGMLPVYQQTPFLTAYADEVSVEDDEGGIAPVDPDQPEVVKVPDVTSATTRIWSGVCCRISPSGT